MRLTDNSLMPFGQHKDKALANVPAKYLLWLWKEKYNEKLNPKDPLSVYIHENLDDLKTER